MSKRGCTGEFQLPRRAPKRCRPSEEQASQPVENPSSWLKLVASPDFGTKLTKAAVIVISETTTTAASTSNHAISYTKAPDSNTWTFRCGHEVNRAEKAGSIQVEDIIPYLKAAIFGEARGLSKQTRRKLSRLPKTHQDSNLRQELKKCGQDEKAAESVGICYFVMLAQERWWFILQRIAEDKKDIGIPFYEDISQYKGWKPPPGLKVEVAIPLPAKLDPTRTEQIMAALMAAGIPNPYPWPESMCILAYQLRRERPESIYQKVVLVIDVGAGTADVQAVLVQAMSPLRLKQVGQSRTEVRIHIKVHNNCLQAWQKLLHDIEEEFEKEKQSFRFRGSENLILRVPGLPHLPDSRICEQGKIIVTQVQLKSIWAPSIKRMCQIVEDTIKEAGKVDQIILCGGSSKNEYLRKEIREHFHQYEVRFPQKQAAGSIPVAMGVVELSRDKQLITKRNIAYGFCIGWWDHWEAFQEGTFPEYCLVLNKVDGIGRVFVTRFFFLPGASLRTQCDFRIRGDRQLRLKRAAMEPDASGRLSWPIEEELFYCTRKIDSDKPIEEIALAIDAGDNKEDIRPMPIPLTFKIYYEDALKWWGAMRHEENQITGDVWLNIEYEIVLHLDGERMTFEIRIPREGYFREQDRDPKTDIRIPVDYNIAALFNHIGLE